MIKEHNDCEEHPIQVYDSSACIIVMPVGCVVRTEQKLQIMQHSSTLLSQARSRKKPTNVITFEKQNRKMHWHDSHCWATDIFILINHRLADIPRKTEMLCVCEEQRGKLKKMNKKSHGIRKHTEN